jgi:N-acyl-D-amino-acid deacylase
MTSAPALLLGIENRGLRRKGFFADIVIFNKETVRDTPSYVEWPSSYSSGIEYVIVNGKVTLENGIFNGVLNGKVLRHKIN